MIRRRPRIAVTCGLTPSPGDLSWLYVPGERTPCRIATNAGTKTVIRYINGRPTPIHLSGGCGVRYDIREHYRSHSSESRCWLTKCPRCPASVYFIRHNGGSVWVDPPPGWPWTKHGCFIEETTGKVRGTVVQDSYLGTRNGRGLELHVVTRIEIHPRGLDTVLHLQSPDGRETKVSVRGEAEIAGEMVVIDPANRQVRFWKGHATFEMV